MAIDSPRKNAYFEPKLGWSSREGAWAMAELGYKPLPNLSLYGYGSVTERERQVGLGARYEFDFP